MFNDERVAHFLIKIEFSLSQYILYYDYMNRL